MKKYWPQLNMKFTETVLDTIQSVFFWPYEKIYSAKYYIVNRWIDQSHAMVAHRKHIKPGEWRDLDYRILYCTFDELVDFVEIEKAYANFRWDEAKFKTLKWWQGGRWRTRTWRSAEAGLDYLRWEAKLLDEAEDDYIPKSQSESAKEVIELYDWWVNIRPARVEPMEASGWSAFCDSRRDDWSGLINRADREETGPLLDKMREFETQYDDEDTEMLIRLIKIRGSLWT